LNGFPEALFLGYFLPIAWSPRSIAFFMPDILLLMLGTVVVNHLALSGLLHPQLAHASDPHARAFTLAVASGVTLLVTAALNSALERWVLLPLGASHLYLLALTGSSCLGAWAALEGFSRRSGQTLPAPNLLLVAANGVVLHLAWRSASAEASMTTAALLAVSMAFGAALLLVTFVALMNRISGADVPPAFRGAPIALIAAGLTALALLGLAGLLPD